MQMPQTKLPWITFLFLFVIFFFAMPYNIRFTVDMMPTPSEAVRLLQATKGNIYRQVSLIMLCLFALNSLFRDKKNTLTFNGALSFTIMFFLLLASLSIIWSDDKLMTIKRLFILYVLWISALSIAKRFAFREIILFAIFSGVVTLLLSIGSEIILGTFKPFSEDYRFAGVMHPNGQAINCSILLISSVFYFKLDNKFPQYWCLLFVLIASIFLILTKSRTALFSVITAITLFFFLRALLHRKPIFISFLTFIMPLFILVLYCIVDNDLIIFDKSVFMLGRDTEVFTLTGRTELWIDLLSYAAKRPLLGYGYDSFLTPQHASELMSSYGSWVGSEHSTYLSLGLGLGVVGLSAFIGILLLALSKSISSYKWSKNLAFGFTFVILISLIINMFLETVLFQPYPFSFLVMVILAKLAFIDNTAHEYELNVK
jgi:exopolysaccharide production protein ExoQ